TLARAGSHRTAARGRHVLVGGKRVRTIDMHCHSYIDGVWQLVKGRPEAAKADFTRLADGPMALGVKTVEGRLREMDRQGIDVQAVSSHQGQYHYWAEPELAGQIVQIQNDALAAVCARRADRFVGIGAVALQHPDLAAEQLEAVVKKLD